MVEKSSLDFGAVTEMSINSELRNMRKTMPEFPPFAREFFDDVHLKKDDQEKSPLLAMDVVFAGHVPSWFLKQLGGTVNHMDFVGQP